MSALAAASEDCRNRNKASLADWAITIKDMKIQTQKLHLKPNVQVLLIADSYHHEQFHKFSLKETKKKRSTPEINTKAQLAN